MRLLTHFLLVALLCPGGWLAAQPSIGAPSPALLSAAAGQVVVRLDEPIAAGSGKVQLQWTINHPDKGGFYSIERMSPTINKFEVLAVLKSETGYGRFIDEQPHRGRNTYRVKWLMESGLHQYSKAVTAMFAGDMTCRFYPNPVDNMLIVRSEQPLDLLITDAGGKVRINTQLQAGLQTVDMSNIEKGMYIITLTQKESGRVMTEKLVKN